MSTQNSTANSTSGLSQTADQNASFQHISQKLMVQKQSLCRIEIKHIIDESERQLTFTRIPKITCNH